VLFNFEIRYLKTKTLCNKFLATSGLAEIALRKSVWYARWTASEVLAGIRMGSSRNQREEMRHDLDPGAAAPVGMDL
jgi:hypothetical protein